MGSPRQEYWSGLPFSFPGDPPNPGIKPISPELPGKFFTIEPPGKPIISIKKYINVQCSLFPMASTIGNFFSSRYHHITQIFIEFFIRSKQIHAVHVTVDTTCVREKCIHEDRDFELHDETFMFMMCVCSVAQLCLTLLTSWIVFPRLLCPWNFPCKNTGVGCHLLLQGIIPTQGLNLRLLHCRQFLYRWVTGASHTFLWWILLNAVFYSFHSFLKQPYPPK